MDTQAAFEKWFESVEAGDDENWQVPKYLSPEWNQYMFRRQLALGAWLASRAAIEIGLPGQENYDDPLSAHLAIKDCAEAITSHGIRIKGKQS